MEDRALLAFALAFAAAALLTPLTGRLARRIGAVDALSERGLAREATPLLGGLAILAAVLLCGVLFLPDTERWRGILAAAVLIAAVGAVDDWRELSPAVKLTGQFAAGLICVLSGVEVDNITLPFVGALQFDTLGGPITLVGLVFLMNVVNFSDGVDGLAAGVCAISAAAFCVIAFDLDRAPAAILAATVAGAALGFLIHNFHPASVFMGDSGANLLGLLLGAVIVEGSLKTNALVALVLPLCVLAVPFLDTGFVIAKRIKYRRPVYRADSNHFHHRFARMGFSQRRTVAYLYVWTALMAGLALAVRFVPYSDDRGNLDTAWTGVMVVLFVAALAASAYLVWVLEILKLKRLHAWRLRRAEPGTEEHVIDAAVAQDLETGEFSALR